MGTRLVDKVAIVTGGGNGIGKAISLQFAAEGADICVADLDMEAARDTADAILKGGRKPLVVKADVSRKEDVEAMVEKVMGEFGRIDVLVNNAGVALYSPFLDYPSDDWAKTLDTNLTGYFFCAQLVARRMISQRSGKILNISSVLAETAMPNSVAYASTKGAVSAFTRVAALELAPYGINVNAIGPGPIMTTMARKTLKEKDRILRESMIPMVRYGLPEDLVGPALFLVSRDSDYVTGQTLYVDGGFLISGLPRDTQLSSPA